MNELSTLQHITKQSTFMSIFPVIVIWSFLLSYLTSFMSTVDALVVLTVEGRAKCLVLGGNTSIFDVIAQLDNFCHFIE